MKWPFDFFDRTGRAARKHTAQLTEPQMQALTEGDHAPRELLRHVARRAVELEQNAGKEQANLAAAAQHLATAGELEEAESLAKNVRDPSENQEVQAAIAEAYARRGDIPKVLQVLADHCDRSVHLRTWCEGLARRGRMEHAVALTEGMESGFECETAMQELAAIACGSGRCADFVSGLKKLNSAAAREAGLAAIAVRLVETGDLKQALAALAQSGGERSLTLTKVGESITRSGRVLEFARAAREMQDPVGRKRLLGTAVELLMQQGHYAEAVDFAHEFGPKETEGLPCMFGELPKEALTEQTLVRAEGIPNERIREEFLWKLAVAFLKAGETEALLEAATRLLRVNSQDSVLNALAQVSMNHGKLDAGARFSSRIKGEKLRREAEDRLKKLRERTAARATEGPAQAVERLKQEILAKEDFNFNAGDRIAEVVLLCLDHEAHGLAKGALGMVDLLDEDAVFGGEIQCGKLGSLLAAKGHTRFVLDWVTLIHNEDHRAEVLAGAAESHAGQGDLELACECASKVRGRLAEIPLQHSTWAKIVSKIRAGKKPQEIAEAIGRLAHRGYRDKLRIATAAIFAWDGDPKNGRQFLAQVEGPSARTEAIDELRILLDDEYLQPEEALDLADMMEEGATKALFYSSAASKLQEAGRPEDAFRVASAVRDPLDRMFSQYFARTEAVLDYVRSGQIDMAIEVASQPKEKSVRANLQESLLEEMLKTGSTHRLEEAIGLALTTASSFNGAVERAHMLIAIAAALCCRISEAGTLQFKPAFTSQEKELARRTLSVLNG